MNHLNESYHSANQALIGQVLSATLDEKPALTKACQCHWIDPHKLRMLLWKDVKPNQPDAYILKIAEQKFVGEARADRRGETYWRFRSLYESREAKPTDAEKPKKLPEIEINQPLSASSPPTDRLAKFQERQAKAQLAQKETKWVEGKEVLAQLEKDREERKGQAQENASPEIKENANFNQPAN